MKENSARSTTKAIETFRPKGQKAKDWLAGIRNYREAGGEYLDGFRQKIRHALAT